MAQKPATSRKLAHGSPLDHVNKPATLFNGKRNGCECAKARVMGGGVATSRGDLRLTMTLERCRDVSEDPAMVVGENAATVGGWVSRGLLDCAPLSEIVDDGDMRSAQGISIEISMREICRRIRSPAYQMLPCTRAVYSVNSLPRVIAGVAFTVSCRRDYIDGSVCI